jgi:hypothetical protein
MTVLGEKDFAHSTLAQLLDDPVVREAFAYHGESHHLISLLVNLLRNSQNSVGATGRSPLQSALCHQKRNFATDIGYRFFQ